MTISIIGSGNVAYHLAKAFTEKNICIAQIFGRNETELKKISEELTIPYSTKELAVSEVYLIAVKDEAISEVSSKIKTQNSLVAHTSGSLPKEILVGDFRKANFYPLQTFSREKKLNYSEVPFFIEAETEEDKALLKDLAGVLSNKVMDSTYEMRKYAHLTAVFACNFVNHLYARAKEISDEQNIPFEFFHPLIEETTAKIKHLSPKVAQTGPAVRNDQKILKMHEDMLDDEMHLKIYRLMNQSIKEMYEL